MLDKTRQAFYPILIGLGLMAGLGSNLFADGVVFTEVVDSSNLAPTLDGTNAGTFDNFFNGGSAAPALSDGNISFWAGTTGGRTGIYTDFGGQVGVIADSTTTMPGSTVTFGEFGGNPSISGTNVAFYAQNSYYPYDPSLEGAFSNIGGRVATVATNVATYNNNGTLIYAFTPYAGFNPAISGSTVTLFASSYVYPAPSSVVGIYQVAAGGSPTLLVPNAAYSPAMSGSNVAYQTQSGGVGALIGGSTQTIAAAGSTLPGGNFTLYNTDGISISGTNVSFIANSLQGGQLSGVGVYSDAGGELNKVADLNTPIPGFSRVFSNFADVSSSNDAVAFSALLGYGAVGGIYSNYGGTLQRIIGSGDYIDGQQVEEVSLGSQGFDGNEIAFSVSFDNGTSGIYLATLPVPEPSSWVTALIGFVTLGGVLASRRRLVPSNVRSKIDGHDSPASSIR